MSKTKRSQLKQEVEVWHLYIFPQLLQITLAQLSHWELPVPEVKWSLFHLPALQHNSGMLF